jgi:hypothetical protein
VRFSFDCEDSILVVGAVSPAPSAPAPEAGDFRRLRLGFGTFVASDSGGGLLPPVDFRVAILPSN